MIMYMYKKICITNRHLAAGNLIEKIESAARSDADIIILREKDMHEGEYESLAQKIISICNDNGRLCMLHSFTDTAIKLGHPYIHLPFEPFIALDNAKRRFFKIIGVSVHSVEEAVRAEQSGAGYITASHIFPTKCKEDLAPRGLAFLKDVCSAVNIPVYALGGIHPGNIGECIECGAAGVCMMSEYMK